MTSTTTETISDSTSHAGASITVHVGRDTIDPQGLGSDEECAACEEHILDAVRAAFPGAEVRAVGNGGRTGGVTRDGEDFTAEVRTVVTQAFDSFEWPADDTSGTAEADAAVARAITVAIDSDCALGGEPLIWGVAEGDDADAARADAREWIGEGGELSPAEVRRRAAGLDVVTIQWAGKLPEGQDRRAIDAALAALVPTEDPATADTECAYCGATHTPPAEVPELGDDEAWEALAEDHADACEWIETRAHRFDTRIMIDQENNAEEWWDAARADAGEQSPAVAALFARIDAATASVHGVCCRAQDAEALVAWASDLPGWGDGPEHAPNPLLVQPA